MKTWTSFYKSLLVVALLFIATALFIIFLICSARADELIIPFECEPKEIQKTFKKAGFNLDLDGNQKTKKSWGFLKNEGSSYRIYSYKGLSGDELERITKILNSKAE